MGVFLVNGESVNALAMGMPGWLWFPLCCLCFILIGWAYLVSALIKLFSRNNFYALLFAWIFF